MRWFFVILFFIPNLAAADKATRDEVLSFLNQNMTCVGIFETISIEVKRFEKSRLVMQFEIDEDFFSIENIERYGMTLQSAVENAFPREKYSTLTDDEIRYLILKLESSQKDAVAFAESIIDDPIRLAEEIYDCATRYDLDK